MNAERNILKRLYENCTFEDDTLDEKTYTVGDTQYWKRGGKTYKWTQSGGRQECSEDEYYKALSGGTSGNDVVKNTDPGNDKARDTTKSSEKLNYSPEMNKFKNALGSVVLDNKEDYHKLVDDLLSGKIMNKSPEVKKLEKSLNQIVTDSDEEKKEIVHKIVDDVIGNEPKSEPTTAKDEIKSNLIKKYGDKVTLGSIEKIPNRNKPGYDAYFAKGYYKDDKGRVNHFNDLMYSKSNNESEPVVDKGKKYKDMYAKATADYVKSQTSQDKSELDNINKHSAKRSGEYMSKLYHDVMHPNDKSSMPKGMRTVQTPAGEMYRVDSKSGSDFIQINPTGKGKYELVVYDNGSLVPTDKKQDLSKDDAFKLAKDAMDKSEYYKTGKVSSIEKRPNAPRIGNKVKILHGGYRGQIGKIVDYDFDDEEGDQYSVEAPDGSIRYLDDTDIELVQDRDDSESDYVNYDGVKNFDHTTWDIDGYETTIKRNDSGIGYYLQNEDFDMEFDTKGDLVNYLRDNEASFAGYDSEKDY